MNWAAAAMPDPYLLAISTMLHRLSADKLVARLWARDASLWHPAPETQARIGERLAWLDLPLPVDQRMETWLQELQAKRYTRVLYVASGPAASAARLWDAWGPARTDLPRLMLLDTTDPIEVASRMARLAPEDTAVVFAGNDASPEMAALCDLVLRRMEHGGLSEWGKPTLLTSASSPLELWLRERCAPRQFLLPSQMPERFGTLSSLGLLPARLQGHDLAKIQFGASRMRAACRMEDDLRENPGVWLGTVLGVLAQHGLDKLTVVAPSRLAPVADWIATFVAGSLSKHCRGFVPMIVEALTEVPSTSDQIVVQLIEDEGHSFDQGVSVSQRTAANHPVLRFPVVDEAGIGATIARWEMAVAVAGSVIGVNPFDEPDTVAFRQAVEHQLTDRAQPRPQGVAPADPKLAKELSRLLMSQPKPSYVALIPYFSPQDEEIAAITELRMTLMEHGYPTVMVQPLRDALVATQLLHAGRPDGALIVLSADRAAAQASVQLSQRLHALCDIRMQTDLAAWNRMRRGSLQLDVGSDVVAGLVQCTRVLRGMFQEGRRQAIEDHKS